MPLKEYCLLGVPVPSSRLLSTVWGRGSYMQRHSTVYRVVSAILSATCASVLYIIPSQDIKDIIYGSDDAEITRKPLYN